MTTEQFTNIILQNPTLTTHGFGIDEGSQQTFEIERENIKTCYDEALACEEFLMNCKRTENPHKDLGSSYLFKQRVERFRDRTGQPPMYIREGALIMAAIHLGFKMKNIPDRTSVYLNISKKTKIHGVWIHTY
jgi:hypothetical protein